MMTIRPNFGREVAKVGLNKAELAQRAESGLSTLHAINQSEKQPNRVGGLRPATA